MKKVFSILAVTAILVGAQSCAKKCVTCTTSGVDSKVCESDYNAANNGNVSWSTYRDALLLNPNCKAE